MEARARHGLTLLTFLLLAFGAGCQGRSPATSGARIRGLPPGEVTPSFQGMGSTLIEAQRRHLAGNLPALKAMHPEITRMGVGLLRSRLPHDLREADLPRFEEGRQAFGRALTHWARVMERGEDQALGSALEALVDAYWGWVDAYKGLPPERSV